MVSMNLHPFDIKIIILVKLILVEYLKMKESLYAQVLIYQIETILHRIHSKMDLLMHNI